MKKDVFGEGKRGKVLSFGELLLAAGISGMPAAYMTTPFGTFEVWLRNRRMWLIHRCCQNAAANPGASW